MAMGIWNKVTNTFPTGDEDEPDPSQQYSQYPYGTQDPKRPDPTDDTRYTTPPTDRYDPGYTGSTQGDQQDRTGTDTRGTPAFDGKNWSGYDRPYGTTGTFTGFDQNKMSNPGAYGDANTSKYAFARYASHYDPRDPDALAKITADMQRDGFKISFDGKDKIDFGDGYGDIDVLRNWEAGKGGDAWAWQPNAMGFSAQPTAGHTPTATHPTSRTAEQTVDVNAPPSSAPGPGWVQVNGGWVPPDHPLATQGRQVAGPETGSGTPGNYAGLYGPSSDSRYSYSGSLQGQTMPTYSGYNYGVKGADLYEPGQFDPFAAPTDPTIDEAVRNAVLEALNNRTFTDEGTNQLKTRQGESALSMAQQLRDRAMQSAASRGVTSGGATGQTLTDIDTAMANQVLSGNRDIDIDRMMQDRVDLLEGLKAGEGYRQGEFDRAYKTGDINLRTRMAQEEANAERGRQGLTVRGQDIDLEKLKGDDAYRAFQSQQDAAQFGYTRDLDIEKLRRDAAASGLDVYNADIERLIQSENLRRLQEALGLQRDLGFGELDLEGRRLGESGRQFNMNHELALKQFEEAMRQFNRQLGFDYAGLLQRGQQHTTDSIMGI